jgi:hypothetical protein
MLRTHTVGALFVFVLVVTSAAAEAKIRCDGRYQVMRHGQPIATPHCEDQYLADLARRAYGVSTTARAVRASVYEKERVCWVVGHDWRVEDICLEFRRDSRGDRWN